MLHQNGTFHYWFYEWQCCQDRFLWFLCRRSVLTEIALLQKATVGLSCPHDWSISEAMQKSSAVTSTVNLDVCCITFSRSLIDAMTSLKLGLSAGGPYCSCLVHAAAPLLLLAPSNYLPVISSGTVSFQGRFAYAVPVVTFALHKLLIEQFCCIWL